MKISQLQKSQNPLDIESLELIGLTIKNLSLNLEKFKAEVSHKLFVRVAMGLYREGLLGQSKNTNNTILTSNLTNSSLLKIEKVATFSLNRPIFKNLEIINSDSGKSKKIDSLTELLDWAKVNNPQISLIDWKQFELEIMNSYENELSMGVYRNFWQKQLLNNIQNSNSENLWDWMNASIPKDQHLSFLEQWGAVGHIYHPGSKTKLGLSKFENIIYSPEFQAEVDIIFAAIHKNISHTEIIDGLNTTYSDWMSNNYPQEYKLWCSELAKKGFDSNDYLMIPVHPWQAEHILESKHKCLIDCHQLIILNNCTYSTKPSMSFRTMLPSKNSLDAHIKLPVAIHATSVMRTVSPESVKTGPRISSVLSKILDKEPQISKSMNIIPDSIGIHTTKACRKDDIRQLSAIFRENPNKYLNEGEVITPLASLFVKTPDNQPLICDILDLLGCRSKDEILEYFRGYTKIALRSCLDLYLLYGIALEAHQQNTLVVFKDNKPQRLMVRDLGGMRLHLPSLSETGISLPEGTFSLTFTNSQTTTRRKFIHACLQSNIGELVLQLSLHYKINEQYFWKIVKQEIQQRFKDLKPRINSDKYNIEYSEILEKPWTMKALTRMRLNDKLDCDKDDMQGDIYVNLQNPLIF
ncbi:ribosomal L29e protein family protein [Candidatus Francisella endociliophora]|uniref:Ribosomal L29e protein family protein n=1 Tax=Candidatus Francisella endociliophora TaxID=653937 RepID=A0A097EPL4_9GAMM|nr:rhizoferrin biosynthesis protein FslA [Francisella sp. FSC1006]AIT09512.1 ribosomal L29e protein family protein [Francisella sp. FSC1006]